MLFEFLYVDSAKSKDRDAKAVSPKKLLGAVEYLDGGRKDGSDTVFTYCNEDTNVSARFVAYRPEHSDEVGLAFEMELPRPTFCAFEALPAALCVAREKRLSIEVLTESGSVFYEEPSFEELLEEWRKANARAIAANGKPYCQATAFVLEAMWEFALVRQDLARRYGRLRIEVPEVYPVMFKKTKTIGRMVDWVGLGKVALGESDWIRLVDPPKPLVDGAIYPAEELTLACKPLVRTVPQPIFHYLCEKPKTTAELASRIEPLKKLSMRNFDNVELSQLFDEQGLPSAQLTRGAKSKPEPVAATPSPPPVQAAPSKTKASAKKSKSKPAASKSEAAAAKSEAGSSKTKAVAKSKTAAKSKSKPTSKSKSKANSQPSG